MSDNDSADLPEPSEIYQFGYNGPPINNLARPRLERITEGYNGPAPQKPAENKNNPPSPPPPRAK